LSAARAALASQNAGASAAARVALQQAYDALNTLMAHTEQAVADVHTETAHRFTGTLWMVVAIELTSFAVAVTISFLLYRSVVGPLRRLRDGTHQLAQGKLHTRLETRGDREFVELQHAFNQMASELESLCRNLERRVAEKGRELAIAERLASVGYLAAGVAHEINNPLAIMSGYAESLLRTAGQQATERSREWVKDLETIRDEAFRCKRITQSLLDLSRLGDEHREPVAIGAVVESCARLIAAWPASRGVTFELQAPTGANAMVLASEPELKQVVLNLLANAVEATAPTRGTVKLGIGRNNGWVEVVVQDNGKGMTPDTLARVFEPFFSNGKPNSGLGLGLSISHAIARRHGGELEASSPGPGRGATLILKLPALGEQH
jgi:signal transduction histidine kinase